MKVCKLCGKEITDSDRRSYCSEECAIEANRIRSREKYHSDVDKLSTPAKCANCGKDFGEIVFKFNRKAENHSPLEIVEGPPPIDFDDVICRIIDDEIDVTMNYIHTYYDKDAQAEQIDEYQGYPVYRIISEK